MHAVTFIGKQTSDCWMNVERIWSDVPPHVQGIRPACEQDLHAGGPGCSSELAVFYENGPFHINDDLTLSTNKYGWDSGHNMIFVDQVRSSADRVS
jgi:Serine carboxypeptidase